jgi:Zn-dependent peptidase ImmA (M78 family)
MARSLGIDVKLSTMKPGQSGKIQREADGRYVIRINRHETRERQRFTLAHEISHFLLHRDEIDRLAGGIVDNVLYRSGASEQKEFEANRLAADLIMPNEAVFSELEALGTPVSDEIIDKLAEIFRVSKAAMEIRLSTVPA